MIENVTHTGRVNVALDIDGVLALNRVGKENLPFFLRKDLILTAIKTHYLVPGVFAFIRFLFSIENVRVSFFSSGAEERNVVFVKELLEKSLSSDQYLKVKDGVKILSKKHLRIATEEEGIIQREKYRGSFRTGTKMKSLKLIVDKGEPIENSILVEDVKTYTAPGEEECLLYVCETDSKIFDQDHCYVYDNSGYRPIVCRSGHKSSEYQEISVLRTHEITIIQRDREITIQFKNETTHQLDSRALDDVADRELIDALLTISGENEKFLTHRMDYKEPIQSLVHEKVKSWGGQTRKLHRHLNRICYVAGMIFHAIQRSRAEGTSVSHVLSRLQFKQVSDNPPQYTSCHVRHTWNDSFYRLGLEKLQEFDPQMTFTSTHSIQQILKDPVTPEEEILIAQYKENEGESCSIM